MPAASPDLTKSPNRLTELLPALCLGLVVGVFTVMVELSFAAMIFSGELSGLSVRAAGLILAGGLACTLCVALFSPSRSMVCLAQDAPAAILAMPAAAVAASMGMANQDATFATVAAVIGVCSLLTGLVFVLMGRLKLANLVRYLPYPVLGGFLAGTGWLLFKGGVGVMSGLDLNVLTVPGFLEQDMLIKWLPGVVFGLGLMLVLERWSHYLILPMGLLGGIAVFYLVLLATGTSLGEARQAGLLPVAMQGGLWPPLGASDLAAIRWDLVLAQLPDILSVTLLCLLGLLLNISGVELVARKDLDLNREMMANGLGNILGGLAGSSPGYSSLSMSSLGPKTGVNSRALGLSAALVAALVLFVGGALIGLVPKAILGGLLAFLGLSFLKEWVLDARSKLSWHDHLLVLLILGFITGLGFLEGVALGVGLTVVLFVLRLSRVPVIQTRLNGRKARSQKARSIVNRRLLYQAGDGLLVFRLGGYLFFGSASQVTREAEDSLARLSPGPKSLVLDMSEISGFDVSAANSLARLGQKLSGEDSDLVLVGAPDELADLVKTLAGKAIRLHCFATLDQALEWCEELLLKREKSHLETGDNNSRNERRDALREAVSEVYMRELDLLEALETLLHSLPGLGRELHLEAGESLDREDGVYVIHWGGAAELRQGARIRGLGQAGVIGAWRLFGAPEPACDYRTECRCGLTFLKLERMRELEHEHPEKIFELYKLLLLMASRSSDTDDPNREDLACGLA